ncbi:hypothetical protein DXX93_13575 [Thalassotalea euphylliae]|uniref:PepSY domain-containing protein n=1 Tax=Thalassotalea euphylliae TaxID=1655234 RepID=A0A3E0TS76_9GAMM|nr:PepSY domain-containing protein [Thalassotalea euphylliae]REL27486.1 hypothetical protein DXX93_13575 [Thalassotalea euphylliae]
MKSKIRLLWMKLHAYFSCFFLPLTLVYIVSGVLYMLDVKGEVKQEYRYDITLNEWPETENEAANIVTPLLAKHDHFALPEDYSKHGGGHNWYGQKQHVGLKLNKETQSAQILIEEYDFWRQMLMIHKGHAGIVFWVLGILFGLSLTFSLISGVVISLQLPQLKKQSMAMLAAGTVTLVVLFI